MWPLNEWSHVAALLLILQQKTLIYIGFQLCMMLASNENAVGIVNQHGREVSQTFILSIRFMSL